MDTIVSHETTALPARFWAKVNKTDACWEWMAKKNRGGYGSFSFGGKSHGVHRLAYAEANGPIPFGMQIDHKCHNRACVNPEHLRLATHKQNMENKGRIYGRSGIRGVSWHKRDQKWMAQVRHAGRTIYLGMFTDLAEAEAVVVAKRLELFTHNDHDWAWAERNPDAIHAARSGYRPNVYERTIERERTVLELRGTGMKWQDVADVLGVSLKAAQAIGRRAGKRIQERV